jgi:isopenicillin-N epimerase
MEARKQLWELSAVRLLAWRCLASWCVLKLCSLQDSSFCNHGSYGACPRPVLDLQQSIAREVEFHPDRFFRYRSWEMTRAALKPLAAFIKANPDDLVFVNNATSGVGAVTVNS